MKTFEFEAVGKRNHKDLKVHGITIVTSLKTNPNHIYQLDCIDEDNKQIQVILFKNTYRGGDVIYSACMFEGDPELVSPKEYFVYPITRAIQVHVTYEDQDETWMDGNDTPITKLASSCAETLYKALFPYRESIAHAVDTISHLNRIRHLYPYSM